MEEQKIDALINLLKASKESGEKPNFPVYASVEQAMEEARLLACMHHGDTIFINNDEPCVFVRHGEDEDPRVFVLRYDKQNGTLYTTRAPIGALRVSPFSPCDAE